MALAAAGVVVVVASQATPRAPRVNCGFKRAIIHSGDHMSTPAHFHSNFEP